MNVFKSNFKKFWNFLKQDTWKSWVVSLILALVFIKFIFFPALSLITGTRLPLVVVESCSMYHNDDFEGWWESNKAWYQRRGIDKEDFENFRFKNGLNKGDIILVSGRGERDIGQVVIFNSDFKFPLIHRIVYTTPNIGTKGDNNFDQLPQEGKINKDVILGRAVFRIPYLGWVKLIFYELLKPEGQKGFCK